MQYAIHYWSMLLHVPSDLQVRQVLVVQPDPEKKVMGILLQFLNQCSVVYW